MLYQAFGIRSCCRKKLVPSFTAILHNRFVATIYELATKSSRGLPCRQRIFASALEIADAI